MSFYNTLLDLEDIINCLKEGNILRISRECGISDPTLYRIRNMNPYAFETNVTLKTLKTLTDYFNQHRTSGTLHNITKHTY